MTQALEKWTKYRAGTPPAIKMGMITTLFIVFGSVVAGIVIERFVAATAPLGYEDEAGFHLGAARSGMTKARKARKPKSIRPELRMQTGVPVGH